MSLFNIGPDGVFLVAALIVSVLVAVLAWRRVDLSAGITAVVATVVALALWQARSPYATPDLNHRIVTAAFIVVPSALLLGVSRIKWLARHAWILVIAGPVLFVGCYIGICELCVKSGLI